MTTDVLETPQHVFAAGRTMDEAIAELAADFERLRRRFPWAMPDYRRLQVTDRDGCPWGRTWFRVGADGRLEFYRANWDSSG
jgi:hypothetical protein